MVPLTGLTCGSWSSRKGRSGIRRLGLSEEMEGTASLLLESREPFPAPLMSLEGSRDWPGGVVLRSALSCLQFTEFRLGFVCFKLKSLF